MAKATRLEPKPRPEIRLDLTTREALFVRRLLSATCTSKGTGGVWADITGALDSVGTTYYAATGAFDIVGQGRAKIRAVV